MNDREYLAQAIDLSRRAPASLAAYSVGALIVDESGTAIASGFSREGGPHYHAEQVALEKAIETNADLSRATLYTSMEPCSVRGSGLRACAARIIDAGVRRVVFAMREPHVFVEGHGAEMLRFAGVEVVELRDEAPAVAAINAHIVRAEE